jgi:hypothetical protein
VTTLHPLGYRKRYLLRAFGYAVRLHVWHGSREDPHDHRWTFVAIPLRGTFLERRWRVRYGGDWIRYVCPPGAGGPDRPLTPDDVGSLAPDLRYLRRPFHPYRCRLGEIHSYEPVGRGPHVSLVFLGRVRREASNVWRPSRPTCPRTCSKPLATGSLETMESK